MKFVHPKEKLVVHHTRKLKELDSYSPGKQDITLVDPKEIVAAAKANRGLDNDPNQVMWMSYALQIPLDEAWHAMGWSKDKAILVTGAKTDKTQNVPEVAAAASGGSDDTEEEVDLHGNKRKGTDGVPDDPEGDKKKRATVPELDGEESDKSHQDGEASKHGVERRRVYVVPVT